MKKHTLLIVSHGSTLNGAERAFFETVKALSLRGYDLYALFPYEGPIIEMCLPFLKKHYITNEVEPWWLCRKKLTFLQKIKRLFVLLKNIWINYKYIKLIDPDVVITNTLTIPCAAIGSKFAKKKHIWYLHELGDEDHGFHFFLGKRVSFRMINSLSQSVFLNSHFLDSKFERFIEQNKRSVVYQPVEFTDTVPSNKASDDSLRLILSGRFALGKGQLDAIKALNILRQNNENVTLTLIGSGEDSYSLQVREYIKQNSLEEHVDLVNFAKNTSSYYSSANVALVCSRCEAFGRITIEAMKMGVVVIASDTGANTELISDNFNGILYQYGNVEDLAKKIVLTKDSKLRERLSKQANKWANETFNLEKYAYKLDTEIKRVLQLPL